MATQADTALEAILSVVEQKTKELADLKRAANVLSRQLKKPEVFSDIDDSSGVGMLRISPDQFYGKTPIVAAREYLEKRGEAVPVEEVLAALERGGFDFDAQRWGENDRLRLLAVSMSKNSAIFHRLPNRTYGLLKWYPDRERRKDSSSSNKNRGSSPKKSKKKSVRKRVARKNASAKKVTGARQAVEQMSGVFTLDSVMKLLPDGTDRATVRARLNQMASEGTAGMRLVEKGALRKPAKYERGGGSSQKGGLRAVS